MLSQSPSPLSRSQRGAGVRSACLAPRLGSLAPFELLVIGLILLSQLLAFPNRLRYLREELLPVVRLWAYPHEQQRMLVGAELYDLLVAADRLLPRQATLLLVTPGADTRHREYVAFHRALYHLAPRPVWWVAPAESDRRPQWWTRSALTAQALEAIARDRGAEYLLFYDVAPPDGLGPILAQPAPAGLLVRLGEPGGAVAAPIPRAGYAGPTWPLRLLGALATIFLAGFAAGTVLRGRQEGDGILRRLLLAWGLGAGLVSLGLFWFDRLGAGLRQAIPILSLAAAGACLLVAVRHPPIRDVRRMTDSAGSPIAGARRPGIRAPRLLLAGSLLALLASQLLFVGLLAVGRPLTLWDSWVTWGMKARIIFLDGGISAGVYTDLSRAVTHLDYPLLVPLVEAWLYGWLGAPDDRLVGAQGPLFYAGLLGLCYTTIRRWGGGRLGALAVTTALAATPNLDGLAGFAFADVPLAFYTTLALVFLAEWLEEGRPGSLAVGILAGGLLPWTKREGLVLVTLIGLGVVVVSARSGAARRAGGSRAAIGLALASALLAGPWLLVLARHSVENTDFLPVTWSNLAANAGRLPTIALIVARRLLNSAWSFLWPIVGLVALLLWRPLRRPSDLFLFVTTGYILVMSAAYLFSAMVPYEGHILSSADRLLAHVAPAAALWATREWLDARAHEPATGER